MYVDIRMCMNENIRPLCNRNTPQQIHHSVATSDGGCVLRLFSRIRSQAVGNVIDQTIPRINILSSSSNQNEFAEALFEILPTG